MENAKRKTRPKSVDYKKSMTLNQIKKEVASFIKYSEDTLIQVGVWDYTDYRENSKTDIDECSLSLEVYISLNDYESLCDNNKTLYIVDIPQKELPQEQFEATEKKLIRESKKIADMLQEAFGDRCGYEYEDDEDGEEREIVIPYKTEIKYYDTSLTC